MHCFLGSAKSHERSGCVFCDSKQFCHPQDYDFQCPCDWHRTEHARQASSVESNIKKCVLPTSKLFLFLHNEYILSVIYLHIDKYDQL